MSWPDIYLLCFCIGAFWSLLSLVLGGVHLGHSSLSHLGHGHVHAPGMGGHAGHGAAGHAGTAHGAHSSGSGCAHSSGAYEMLGSWLGSLVNPNCAAIFLTWFGGVGYILMRHTGLTFWVNLLVAIAVGCFGAFLLAAFLRFLQSREQPMRACDYEMIGVLGKVSSSIRPEGIGEVIYVRDGARRPVPARSEDGRTIGRGEEVVVTRYEKGIAYVRTWEAMTQLGGSNTIQESS
jgi:membrane protein implicated in regulation of membrane protease activity